MKLSLVVMLLGLSGQAFGATLFGQTVQISHEIDLAPAGSIDDYRCGPSNFVVDHPGGTVEIPSCDSFVSIDVSDTNILLDFLATQTPTGGIPFNGLHFFDVNGTITDIIGVAVNGATNLAGIAPRVTFDANNIWFEMGGLPAQSTSIVSLDVTLAPEPSSWLLIGTGFAAIFLLRRRIVRS